MSTWPADWEERRRGVACPACAEGRPETIPDGRRFSQGPTTDAYLCSPTAAAGYTVVFWRGRHVADLTELDGAEWSSFTTELRLVSRAIEAVYRPAKLNVMLLGNTLPHLHAHIVPRYLDDPNPSSPPLFMMDGGEALRGHEDSIADLRAAVEVLRAEK